MHHALIQSAWSFIEQCGPCKRRRTLDPQTRSPHPVEELAGPTFPEGGRGKAGARIPTDVVGLNTPSQNIYVHPGAIVLL